MGSTNTGTVMTIANSIIGVSVLAMPFCFKECGIVLSILMLILSSILSRLTCYLLLKSAVMARRRNFEFLAFHIFGPTGKFVAELCIIGFLMGTCIAFFVVVGDLGPAIISKTLALNDMSGALRPSVLIGLALIVVLPLGLLRNVDSLSSICTATIGFYLCLVLKVIAEALPHLLSGIWMEKVHLWRPAGVLQCLPIFSMALFCQTQLFEIYDSIPNASFERMNGAVRSAINLCACVYISVGFFGYVAFCTQSFGGNILMSFSPTMMSEVIKVGFVLSVAVSFPLVIFPCRASLYSLLFRRIQFPPYNEGGSTFIPEARFKCITVFIIAFSLLIGLLIPNIELVLGLVGSTIGVGICVMFPALAFLLVTRHQKSGERMIAQALLVVGLTILVLGTYATLSAASTRRDDEQKPPLQVVQMPEVLEKTISSIIVADQKDLVARQEPLVPVDLVARQEPPVPVDPVADKMPEKPVDIQKPAEEKPKPDVAKPETVVEEVNKSKEKGNIEAVINKDALKKEDEELAQDNVERDGEKVKKEKDLLKTLEKHKEEQNKLLEEQREIIQKLKEEKEKEDVKQEAKEAVAPPQVIVPKVEEKPVENVVIVKQEQNVSKILPQLPAVDPYQSVKQESNVKPVEIKPADVTPDSPPAVRMIPIKSLLRLPPKPVHLKPETKAIENEIPKLLPDVKVNNAQLEDAKSMRRDILETGDGHDREKREAENVIPNGPNCLVEDKTNTTASAVASKTEEMKRDGGSQEKEESLIKISAFLSDPVVGKQEGLMDLSEHLSGPLVQADLDKVMPMKRDLKSVDGQTKSEKETLK